MKEKIRWQLKKFKDLAPFELYEIMQLRQLVFILEQNCAYIDADGKDLFSYHLTGRIGDDNALAAYARIVFPEVSYKEVSIGRVVTAPVCRQQGLGILLMHEALKQIENIYGKVPVRIGAQFHLIDFYKKTGFLPEGEPYMEDGIKHVLMLRKGMKDGRIEGWKD